ncbi:plant invertase/pectin methylesterase inhibitor [Striga asiatica]|uniref:Pectinesterase n=1 Tax=Striga asiatica TaxID=4170 RepID=A0A5A7QX01_STRAF|nr:plant invertase/pectin methylesterase inhibitor [Striga asiatica]
MAVNLRNKTAIAGVCSLLLVAMVVAVIFGGQTKNEPDDPSTISSSQKAIANLCHNTDYRETCVDTLTSSSGGNNATSDPNELIERAFRATINDIRQAAQNSSLFLDLTQDPRGKSALDSCQELAGRAAADLERSLDKFAAGLDFATLDDVLSDLKIWLSGAITYQETCLDGFEGIEGDAGERMRSLLTRGMQMTSNGLAMVNEISSVFQSIGAPTLSSNRRLLMQLSDAEIIPDWVDAGRRRLLMNNASAKIEADIVVAKDGTVQGDYFTAKDIAFENYAGAEKHQAVALRVSADLVLFHNCRMDGYQDTLYAHTYRQFYRNCTITGTIDFVFGDSAAIFQDCTFVVRKPLPNQSCIVTAQGRKDIRQPTGLVLQNCSFIADPDYFPLRHTNKAYLGRPWKEFSRTIILESFLDDLIQPQGWLPWNETFALDTLFYTEFNNRGPAASKAGRVTWAGVKELPASRIRRFTADEFIDGKRWVPVQGIPYAGGFMLPIPAKDENAGAYSPVVPEEDKDIGGSKDKSEYIGKNKPSASKVPTTSIAAAPESSYVAVASPSPLPSPYNNNNNNEDTTVAAASSPASSPALQSGKTDSGSFFGLW